MGRKIRLWGLRRRIRLPRDARVLQYKLMAIFEDRYWLCCGGAALLRPPKLVKRDLMDRMTGVSLLSGQRFLRRLGKSFLLLLPEPENYDGGCKVEFKRFRCTRNYLLVSESTDGKNCETRAPKWWAPNICVRTNSH